MQIEIIFAGFGGQGVMFAGQLISYTAMHVGKHVTWIPSYGPEMRGGTANCTVVISDEPVGSPVVRHPECAVVFNVPSFDRYAPQIKAGGLLVVNSSLIDHQTEREDITVVEVPANGIAGELGSSRLLNMVMVGALLAHRPVFTLEDVVQTLDEKLTGRKRQFLEPNIDALHRGHAFASPEKLTQN